MMSFQVAWVQERCRVVNQAKRVQHENSIEKVAARGHVVEFSGNVMKRELICMQVTSA
jgi:hypothetical protein